jgi:cyclopropane fatty-acyl-phospholipid synthase-like methyltransferase
MSLQTFIAKQFRRPDGLTGRIISGVMRKGNRIAYERLISFMNITSNDELLEIGYGHGTGIQLICNRFDCHLTGIDFSELMFREAGKRNSANINNGRVSLYNGDYVNHRFLPLTFDKVFFINVIYFWTNIEVPFKKIYEELKDDGRLFIYMAHRDDLNKLKFTSDDIFNKYSIDFVEEKLKLAGFREIIYKFDKGFYISAAK